MLIAHVLQLSYYRKKLQNLSHFNYPVDNSIWKILHDLELLTMPLTNGCRNYDVIQLGSLCYQSLFLFVQISDAYLVHLFCNSYNML